MSLWGIRTGGVAFKCSFMSSAANAAAFPSRSSLCSPCALGLYLFIIPTQRTSENALSASCKCNSWRGCIRLWLCQELDRFVAAAERGSVGKHIGTHHSSILQLEEKMTEKGLQTWSDISKEKVWKHQRFIHPVKNQHQIFICDTACSYVTRECCLLSGFLHPCVLICTCTCLFVFDWRGDNEGDGEDIFVCAFASRSISDLSGFHIRRVSQLCGRALWQN